GAHEGVGLDYQFLRHVERTRVIVHVIDMASTEGRDPYEDYVKINEELNEYDRNLEKKQKVVVANKMNMQAAEEQLTAFKQQIGDQVAVFPISTLTKTGLRDLLFHIANTLAEIPKEEAEEPQVIIQHKAQSEAFHINKVEADVYELSGDKIE